MRSIYLNQSFKSFYQRYPLTLIDVGASGGISGRWKRAEKYLQVVGFEPDLRAYEKLRSKADNKQRFINTALHSSDGTIKLNLTRKPICSSIFKPNKSFLRQFPYEQRYDILDVINLKARQLSRQLLNSEGIYEADFLKLDAQGAEYIILQSAKDLLNNHIFGVEVEVEFAPIYCNQPLFSDIDNYLRGKGYQLFDLKRYFWKRTIGMNMRIPKGQLIFADALYFRTYESFFDNIANLSHEHQKAKILKSISICLIYGIDDYALYLCDKAVLDNLFADSEKEIIFNEIYSRRKEISFRGQHRLATLLYKIYSYLKSREFCFSDEKLGNR